ncbi:hypothetical protein SASPL_154805 [Salvia splendens]|uniref:F-type H+-transporting ATPase subunit delta n=1 Tax=Salvia splendens TaxID=180675 RepID=A0A8X8Z038_SALSN|nr:hypothetical protein SASPL_154805 [Salvia splendens]
MDGYGEVTALKGCDSRESLATAHAVSCRRRRLYREDEDAESADLDVESTDGDAELGMIVVNFTDMKRVDLIKEIAAEFELIANRLSETEVATVASVVELEPQHLAEIAKRAQKLTGPKKVKLKTVIDKSLLAGIIIRIIEEFGALFIKARICPSKGGDRFQL